MQSVHFLTVRAQWMYTCPFSSKYAHIFSKASAVYKNAYLQKGKSWVTNSFLARNGTHFEYRVQDSQDTQWCCSPS